MNTTDSVILRILRLAYDLVSDGYLVPRRIFAVSEKLS
jgi:hypothetical protein